MPALRSAPRPRSSATCRSLTLLAASALLVVACASPRPIEVSRADGAWHLEYGRYQEAADAYAEIIERYPGDWDAQYNYGRAMAHLGELDAAERSLETASILRPNNSDIVVALADVLAQRGDSTRLYQLLRNEAESTGEPWPWILMSRYALEAGDPDTARTAALNAIETSGPADSAEAYIQAAAVADSAGDTTAAIRRLRQAYGINPYDRRVTERLVEYGEVPGPTLALPPGR